MATNIVDLASLARKFEHIGSDFEWELSPKQAQFNPDQLYQEFNSLVQASKDLLADEEIFRAALNVHITETLEDIRLADEQHDDTVSNLRDMQMPHFPTSNF